jgi:ubiquinone/menaquinone biosynthesis C-methylase UbiE
MIRDYFNQRADIWDAEVAEKSAGKLRRMADRLGLERGSVLLDVGSGTGVFLPWLLEKTGTEGRIVALDCAERMLEKSRQKGFPPQVSFLCASIEEVPLPDASFDAVVCYSSFPHFGDKPRAFREMYRVLRPGGRLVICHTSSRAQINRIHAALPEVSDHLIPGEAEMREMMGGAGFTAVNIEDGEEDYLASAAKG